MIVNKFKFNEHPEYEGKHAFLAPSNPSWLGWDNKTVIERKCNSYSKDIGTILHALASDCIKHKVLLDQEDCNVIRIELSRYGIPNYAYDPEELMDTISLFVNDCIRDGMSSERVLFVSENAFGTADAIKFDANLLKLKIRDLKTGDLKGKIDQLKIYAAYFCIEYGYDPMKLKEISLALYQYGGVDEEICDPAEIADIMTNVLEKDEVLKKNKRGF